MKVYFDQDVWQCVCDTVPVSEFKQTLGSKQIEICLGMYNIYEFGRCFLDRNNSKNTELGKKIFQYLCGLDIDYFLKLTDKLIESDLDYARTGGKLLPYLDGNNAIATKKEMCRLARGYSDRARRFIQRRENRIAKSLTRYGEAVRKENTNVPKPKNFDELQSDWGRRRAILNQSEFEEKARNITDTVLFSDPGKYPFLNTYINCQLHLNFIALTNPGAPGKKSMKDYRHLINANAADYFVTNDKTQQCSLPKLSPYNLKAYRWSEFKENILRMDSITSHN